MILPVRLDICANVWQLFECAGKVEIARPQQCPRRLECGSKEPLWRNGSYSRQVIYWGLFFVLSILRFRCRKCGKTVSCPYGWLVPYRRFSAEVIGAGVDAYASGETSYRDETVGLSDLEFAESELDIRKTQLYADAMRAGKIRLAVTAKGGLRPSHCTIFYWVEFVCKKIEVILQQLQKELVRRQNNLKALPSESTVENKNSWKAAQTNKKVRNLNKLTFATLAAEFLLAGRERVWEKLRAYFLVKAESCRDLLTDTLVRLSTTHTFELVIF